ncbi:E3 ubiquitin-protein ligase TRIM71-like [Asterias rubens]|uniref:E3 ubiquitin-protein ligase TRIM71-like n=1 Tax=Asterias rubens TaxID=7604 RepID=UPI00145568F9|nr:E3 ubiquitin-protein ligase TRIM71-like [Asterias rubens]
MASRVEDQPLIEKISERLLVCQICMDRFKEPKMLECSHSFCLECLQHLAETHTTSPTLICPLCRGQTLLQTQKGVADLRTDFKLISLLDEIEQHETKLQEIQQPTQGSVSKCSKHTDKDVIMYCDSCKQLTCTTCIAKDHRMHDYIELNEAVDNCKKKADILFAELDQQRIDFKIALQDIAISRKRLDSVVSATKAKISKKANKKIAKEVARIREEEQKLMVDLDKIHKDRAKTMEIAEFTNKKEITTIQNMKDEVIPLMEKETFYENLHLIEKLLLDINKYTAIQPTKVPHGLSYMEFENDEQSLGRLVPEEDPTKLKGAASAAAMQPICEPQTKLTQNKWLLKKEITNYKNRAKETKQFSPCDIAVHSNSDIVVADFESTGLIVILAGSTTTPQQTTSIKDLYYPSRVTVNKNDELVGVDHEAIKIFNRKYQLLHQFQGVSRWPSCIAVDKNNMIAIGYTSSTICLHRPDGSLITTLLAPGIGQYLTFHKDQIIYTKWDDKKIVSVDYNGGIIFSVDINQSRWPRGVCCDEKGNIYVAVGYARLTPTLGEIQQYSPDGTYIGPIIKLPDCPYGIKLTASGDLVVTTEESVCIYHRVI